MLVWLILDEIVFFLLFKIEIKTCDRKIFLDFHTVTFTQCVNFRIFLPLRFYVKSILVILKPQKLPFWPFQIAASKIFEMVILEILELQIMPCLNTSIGSEFWFYMNLWFFCTFQRLQFTKSTKFIALKVGK